MPGKISATTWKVEILLTLETKLLSFICTLVTGLILHTMNLYIFGGGWFVFMLMLLDHKIYCTGRGKSNSDSVEFVETGILG